MRCVKPPGSENSREKKKPMYPKLRLGREANPKKKPVQKHTTCDETRTVSEKY